MKSCFAHHGKVAREARKAVCLAHNKNCCRARLATESEATGGPPAVGPKLGVLFRGDDISSSHHRKNQKESSVRGPFIAGYLPSQLGLPDELRVDGASIVLGS
jgi:hypothetical protein